MKNIRFDISPKRLHPLWLILGAIAGRALGLVGALNFAGWYFTKPAALIGWQIFAAIACAIFTSFLMTSKTPIQTKGAILGLGTGLALTLYTGEIWTFINRATHPDGLISMTVSEGITFDWVLMHCSWLGAIVGWIIAAYIARRRRKIASPNVAE